MEFTKSEINVIEQLVNETSGKDIQELHDLDLSLVGGGIADPIWA
jgi:hypothetical protein